VLRVKGSSIDVWRPEAGGHRMQSVPPGSRGVQSSTVVVTVVDADARGPGGPWDRRGAEDFRAVWFSGTGKGGQHRNKTQCSLRLTHVPTGLVETRQSRSRADNARDARAALEARLDAMAASAGDRRASEERRRQGGTGERSDKVRTWRFQEGQVIDHRTGRRARLEDVAAGNFVGLSA
jgi:peptide chain release factor 1